MVLQRHYRSFSIKMVSIIIIPRVFCIWELNLHSFNWSLLGNSFCCRRNNRRTKFILWPSNIGIHSENSIEVWNIVLHRISKNIIRTLTLIVFIFTIAVIIPVCQNILRKGHSTEEAFLEARPSKCSIASPIETKHMRLSKNIKYLLEG